MVARTKKRVLNPADQAVVKNPNERKRKPFSLTVYHENDDLSIPQEVKDFLERLYPSKICAKCGKSFTQKTKEYAWGDCCSYSCALHRNDGKKKANAKPVQMYTQGGRLLQEFESAVEASRYVGMKKADGIRDCCNGKTKTSAGFVWRWKEKKT